MIMLVNMCYVSLIQFGLAGLIMHVVVIPLGPIAIGYLLNQ